MADEHNKPNEETPNTTDNANAELQTEEQLTQDEPRTDANQTDAPEAEHTPGELAEEAATTESPAANVAEAAVATDTDTPESAENESAENAPQQDANNAADLELQTEEQLTQDAPRADANQTDAPEAEHTPGELAEAAATTESPAANVAETAVENATEGEEDEMSDEAKAALARQREEEVAEARAHAVKSELLSQILDEDFDSFNERLENATLGELVLVMEELAEAELERDTIRKVGQTKKRFDQRFAAALEDTRDASADNPEKTAEKETAIQLSNRFSTALGTFNRRRGEYEEALEDDKKQNSKAKETILEKLRDIVHDEKVTAIKEVRALQDEWKSVGPVLPKDAETFFRNYRALLDQFYNLREGYIDLLKQDRKVNLEKKQQLVVDMRAKVPENVHKQPLEFWKKALEEVRDLHKQWKKIGPVPREQSDIIWQLFKDATDEFYDKRRSFFEKRDKEREENAIQKREILAEAQGYGEFDSQNIDDWRKASDEMKALQAKWRKVGQVPYKDLSDLNKAFRKAMDTFFDRRSEYFSELDKERDEAVAKKQALLDEARELKDQPLNKATAEAWKALQRRWKKTGPDHFRDARKIQKKFRKAADKFFKAYKQQFEDQKKAEKANLEAKRTKNEALEQLIDSGDLANKTAEFEKLIEEWLALGLVPIKKRDKLEKDFLNAVRAFYDATIADKQERKSTIEATRIKLLQTRPNSEDRLRREEQKLQRQVRGLEDEVKQYENNIMLIAPGRKGDSLRDEINERIEASQAKVDAAKKKLREIRKMKKDAKKAKQAAAKAEKATKEKAKAEKAEAKKAEQPSAKTEQPEAKAAEGLEGETQVAEADKSGDMPAENANAPEAAVTKDETPADNVEKENAEATAEDSADDTTDNPTQDAGEDTEKDA